MPDPILNMKGSGHVGGISEYGRTFVYVRRSYDSICRMFCEESDLLTVYVRAYVRNLKPKLERSAVGRSRQAEVDLRTAPRAESQGRKTQSDSTSPPKPWHTNVSRRSLEYVSACI